MKDMKAKLKQQGGFTLIEMLLVVAIISILVAISIPVVNMNLEKAREAADLANERAAKTLATLLYMGELDYNSQIADVEYWDGTDYLPGMAWPFREDDYGNATGIFYDAEKGVLSFKRPTGYGQRTGYKGDVILVTFDKDGVFTPFWVPDQEYNPDPGGV